ncbi:MAG: hypothetical protein IV093_02435 [Rubrivivax sp.]|nr:hypothetical protein [Rubrivivax sp.]
MASAQKIHAAQQTRTRADTSGVLFAVYAPFGDDPVLSHYPGKTPRPVHEHPLVKNLLKVAAAGAHVSALIDLVDDCTYLVEIPALQPKRVVVTSAWKQDMGAPCTLAGFLQRAHGRFPCSALLLALEGHGAGYLPSIDGAAITPASTNGNDGRQWIVDANGTKLREEDGGIPVLPVGFPTPPLDSPESLPVRLPLSTWDLGEALRRARAAQVPAPLVIHFNNCFNLSLELLHTVAPFAGYATAYGNYNFFTAGDTYPAVFEALRSSGGMSVETLAKRFGQENHAYLLAKQNHPTLGGCVRLSRLKTIAAQVDSLALELVKALDPADPAWTARRARIQTAIRRAQQLDADGDYGLEVPDGMSDLGSVAVALQAEFPGPGIGSAAGNLLTALNGIWLYGDHERPWLDESQVWDFRARHLGLNVFLPDPDLKGVWDWRSPYYLAGRLGTGQPPAIKQQIPFLLERNGKRAPWVQFIVDYHRDIPFDGYQRAQAPVFPVFNPEFKPKYPPPQDDRPTEPKKPTRR